MTRGSILYEKSAKKDIFSYIPQISIIREKHSFTIYTNGIYIKYYNAKRDGQAGGIWNLGFINRNRIRRIYEVKIPEKWRKKNGLKIYQIETADREIIILETIIDNDGQVINALQKMIGKKWGAVYSKRILTLLEFQNLQHIEEEKKS